jgi:putative ABC transport system permease protein
MRRNPGFAIAAILTLGLGIGANTTVFNIVNAILLRPLPYRDSSRLVRIVENIPAGESFSGAPQRTTGMSPAAFMDWRSKTTTLAGMAMERKTSMTLIGREAIRLSGLQASPALFPMLAVRPAVGRAFEATEEQPGSDKVVILSQRVWVNHFGSDPQILGKPVTLDDTAYTVVGVMPAEFVYPDPQTDFWTPLVMPVPQILSLPVIARLKDNVTLAAAADEATNIAREFRGESPGEPQPPGPPRIQLMTVKDELVDPIRLPFLVFVIAVTFVLLVACVNVANLFLARSTMRQREICIRLALGAGRLRLLRQLLTENFILASLGGVVGIALAFAGSRLFVALGQGLARPDLNRFELAGNAIPRLNEITIDTSVLLFTLVLTAVTGVLFGIMPALQIRRRNAIQVVNSTSAFSSNAFRFARAAMVVGQIALTMILLLGAGLMIKSFLRLANTNLGYDSTNVLTFKIPQPQLNYPQDRAKQRQQNAFAQEVVDRIASRSDVQGSAFTNELPMVQGFFAWLGREAAAASRHDGRISIIGPDYFRVMGIRVVTGRVFNNDDRRNARPVYVINKTAARDYFKGADPIGKTVSGAGFPAGEIVGVVDDIRQSGVESEPIPQLFMNPDHIDAVWGIGYYFVVRTTREAGEIVPAVRSIVRDLDPKLVVDDVATMNQIVSNSITTPRSYAVLLGTFSTAALVLAMIGLYGLLAYFVKQRTQEIGIRVALGAQRFQILLLVVRQGLALSIAGAAIGVAGSAALMKYLQKMLFGVNDIDPATFIVVSALFMLVALLASYIPARQATNIDPLACLRHE